MSSSSDKESLRILMLVEDFYPRTSGGAFSDWKFAQIAVERGHSVTVYADRVAGSENREIAEGVDIRRPHRMKPKGKHVNSSRGQIRRILLSCVLCLQLLLNFDNTDFDVIYSTNHVMHPVAKILKIVYGIPVVNFVAYSPSARGSGESTPKSVFVFEEVNFRLFMGDIVVCRTPEVRELVRNRSSASVELIGGVLNQDTILSLFESDQRHQSPNGTQLVFVGRLVQIKNPKAALDVLAELPERYHLTIIGDGPEHESLVERIQSLDLQDRVELAGRLSHEETLERIAQADGLILTSHTEAYPTVVFEALALNTDVFASPVGILPEIKHERLHITDTESMSTIIEKTDPLCEQVAVDKETLDRFSMERFTDEALAALYKAAS